jgi:hypothetical protein
VPTSSSSQQVSTRSSKAKFMWAASPDWKRINGSMLEEEFGEECRGDQSMDFFPWPQHVNSTSQGTVSVHELQRSLFSARVYAVIIKLSLSEKREILLNRYKV